MVGEEKGSSFRYSRLVLVVGEEKGSVVHFHGLPVAPVAYLGSRYF